MREMKDEARLTAYALGELPENERAEIEKQLATSEEIRREVEEIRATAAALRDALAAAPRQQLNSEQRAIVETAAGRSRVLRSASRRRWAVAGGLAAAACLVVAALVVFTSNSAVAPYIYPLFDAPATSGVPQHRFSGKTQEQLRTLGYVAGDGGQRIKPALRRSPKELERLKALGYIDTDFNTEAYDHISDNPFILVSQDPRSTFSVDVDTASYSNVRRFLLGGSLPPKDAVRIEELINYFAYDYAAPTDDRPFAVHMDETICPWKPEHRLVRIGIKGRELPHGERPPSNLVFLLDVSGSMDEPNKLPLVQASMRLLVNELSLKDRVAIAVYAGSEGLALPSTSVKERDKILDVIENLSAGGTTQGSAGIQLAYQVAAENFIKGGVNRVILATDGDFNVGITNQGDLIRLIEEKAKSGVFLTALGFGMGNLKDSTLQKLADHGNGNYAYIDSLWEARKVLVEQIGSTLVTIAKDLKLQIEFNPAAVKAFRLIGYEKRVLAHQDFNDDKKDAGDIGAGHTVTALYEVVPVGVAIDVPGVDPLKYQEPVRPTSRAKSDDLLTLKLRYKQPDADKSQLMELTLADRAEAFDKASTSLRFAAAVASFGMVLRDSPYKGDSSFASVLVWAKASLGQDRGSSRAEFLTLVEKARHLTPAR
jgi:Ca-activated chloride channel homolog